MYIQSDILTMTFFRPFQKVTKHLFFNLIPWMGATLWGPDLRNCLPLRLLPQPTHLHGSASCSSYFVLLTYLDIYQNEHEVMKYINNAYHIYPLYAAVGYRFSPDV